MPVIPSGARAKRTRRREIAVVPTAVVIPSGAPKARRRGIAIVPIEGYPLFRDDRDSSPPALRASARNDNALFRDDGDSSTSALRAFARKDKGGSR